MSHSHKDAVGGHRTGMYWEGIKGMQMNGRRWAKKFNRREARREAKATIRNALELLAADVHDDWIEANDDFYEMCYEEWRAGEEIETYDDTYEYYDPYDYYDDWYDWRFEDSYVSRPAYVEPEPVTVAYHKLNEPVYAAGESLGEILERVMKKG